MSVVIKGSEPFDVMIASNIMNCQTANIKFKNISFQCETIEDAAGTVFVKMPSAQPEIIRCIECRWGREPCDGNIECFVDDNVPPEYHGYDWFCPNGERRSEE